jgi:hypothetical protein
MKFGFRKPSLKKRISARTSPKRFIRHSLKVKAPKGMGWLTNPKKAAYNRVYNRTSRGCLGSFIFLGLTCGTAIVGISFGVVKVADVLF